MGQTFRYVVTPNADHIIRIVGSPDCAALYNDAWLCVNDSRVVQLLLRIGGYDLPAIRGSDLTAALLGAPWMRNHRVIVIGGDERVSLWLQSRIAPHLLAYHNPSMGFCASSERFNEVINFIELHLPGIVFLAVGSPNQELVAAECLRRGLRGGIAVCIGAGIVMAAGIEKRAPVFMQCYGLEWLYRLVKNPRRLAWRYFRDIRIVTVVAREIIQGRLFN